MASPAPRVAGYLRSLGLYITMPITSPKFERRLLRGIVRLLDDENRQLRRLRFIYWTVAIAGGVLIAAGLWPIAARGSSMFWAVLCVGLGGFVCGYGNFYYVAYRQWPFLKRYLNAELIRDDYRKTEPNLSLNAEVPHAGCAPQRAAD